AVAAYFADALRRGDDRWSPLPGAPRLRELADRADRLADITQDRAVRQLADTIRQAGHLE
ncbi:MAG: VWA domain-containing protein, partial [Streptomyces sp.]|nr:VWA domain-containing protein [Streptomyces sp.]